MLKDSSNEKVGIIIPMYNEEKNAKKCIDTVVKEIKELPQEAKLIVINDGSKDKTSTILSQQKELYKKYIVVLTHKKNKGYGAATQTGIEYAIHNNFIWVLHMDSDLTNDPKYIKDFFKKATDNVDCVKASRYISGGVVIGVSTYRKFISTIGNYIARLFFNVGISDCTNGFRLVRVKKLNGAHFTESNFSIILEELLYLKKQKAHFAEIPYTLTARSDSRSKFNYKPQIFYSYFKYAFKALFV